MSSRCAKLVACYTCKDGASVICSAVFMKTTVAERKWAMLHDLRGQKNDFLGGGGFQFLQQTDI